MTPENIELLIMVGGAVVILFILFGLPEVMRAVGRRSVKKKGD